MEQHVSTSARQYISTSVHQNISTKIIHWKIPCKVLLIMSLQMIHQTETNGQVTVPTNAIGAADYVGSSNANNVVFKGNGTTWMTLLHGTGNLGIGIAAPAHKLEVNSGDLNLMQGSAAFRLAGDRILWHNNNVNNLFLGKDAGNATLTGTNNTLIGNGAGNLVSIATNSTFVGKDAGYTNYAGSNNVFVGANAGYGNHDGHRNTFVGTNSGGGGGKAYENTFIGFESGYNQYYGKRNTYVGNYAGQLSTDTEYNSYFGFYAGYSGLTNDFNTAVGGMAGYSNTSPNNAYFGYEAGRYGTTGVENTYLGNKAGKNNVIGSYNTAVGFEAGLGADSYSYNSFFGAKAGRAITTGESNTFLGYNTGSLNTAGNSNVFVGSVAGLLNSTGNFNVFVGAGAGSSNTTGGLNTLIGYNSGSLLTTANHNTLLGAGAGGALITGAQNTMVGYLAGQNTTNWYNTFLGYHAGRYTTTGQHNICTGHQAGRDNTTGNQNVFIGNNAGLSNTTGSGNTAIGYQAGDSYATGSNNTFIGRNADANGTYSNAAAIGNGAVVTGSNRMEFGNTAITGCYNVNGNWTISDGRFKFNVNENVSGLDFIKRLRPVTYQLNAAELDAFLRENMSQTDDSTGQVQSTNDLDFGPATAMIHAGFIAQEVEEAAIESGFVSSIVSAPIHDNDHYAISYAQIVVPLVKAVQEQQEDIEHQNGRLAQLEEALAQMQRLLEQCCARGADMRLDGTGQGEVRTTLVELGTADGAILYQNRPNPFTESTVINYYLPKSVKLASMVFYDNTGRTLKEITLFDRGNASVTVQPNGLAAGIYTYSLTVEGKTIETKRMVKGN